MLSFGKDLYWSLLYELVMNFLFRKVVQDGVLLLCFICDSEILREETVMWKQLSLFFIPSCAVRRT